MRASAHTGGGVVALVGALVAGLAAARPASADEPMVVPPSLYEGVGVTEHLGGHVPLDARFRDQDGRQVTLGQVVRGDLPVLLTFNYSNCPQLWVWQRKGRVKGPRTLRLQPGRQFRIATTILAPGEPPARAARTRAQYVAQLRSLGGDVTGDGWTFLVAQDGRDEGAIHAGAAAAGSGYRYDQAQDEYAHPATLIALSAIGEVTRYVHGVAPVGSDLELTIVKAGLAEPSAASGFVMACFHWNPDGRAAWGQKLMKYGALVFVSAFAAAIVAWLLWRRSRHPSGVTPS